VPDAWDEQCCVLPVALKVWRHALHDRVSRSDVPRVDASLISEMKQLQAENARLKRMYADMAMQNELVKEALAKK
jgi:hypothetical protein